ncbi:MAG: serine/threonine protein phosphatase [Ruminococcaceae bacterium]|nr:serine/threonine protein phosphatase [Oscillospiraceae bacterium]
MIYYTGDIHGSADALVRFCINKNLQQNEVVILLGDVGANYCGGKRDQRLKEIFAELAPTFLCIHGNHEMRPGTIESYIQKEWCGGTVWYETDYPNLLFAKDGEIYTIEGLRHIAIGGAYSVDKYYRLMQGFGWWQDEQPSEEIKAYVERQLASHTVDVILSHTCPYKYEPIEMFLTGIDQSTVDTSTELWLDQIEEKTEYKAWYCGHWHINKRVEKIHFLFHSVETSD